MQHLYILRINVHESVLILKRNDFKKYLVCIKDIQLKTNINLHYNLQNCNTTEIYLWEIKNNS